MFDFKKDVDTKEPDPVPYFEDATAANGWQGQSTGKSIETLKTNIIGHIGKLGGLVVGFEKGSWGNRNGYRIRYVIETPEGKHVPGYIDAAALPLKPHLHFDRRNRTPESVQIDKALRMALYNVSECLGALWKLQRLSPGFAPLMPFMVGQNGMNLTQMWSSGSAMKALMPPQEDFQEDGDVVDGEVKDI
jgi:hypothetical protein